MDIIQEVGLREDIKGAIIRDYSQVLLLIYWDTQ